VSKPSQKQIREVISKFLGEVNNALIKGEEIRLPNHFTLLTYYKAERKERKGKNLRTGEELIVPAQPAQYAPKCKFSLGLKKDVAKRKKEEK
jgi:nucleoid DNA-binding protein